MPVSTSLANRIGFILLGLTNNFAFMLMLSAAYDLLKQLSSNQSSTEQASNHLQPSVPSFNVSTEPPPERYCNSRSTSSVLLANSLPALLIKLIIYPLLLADVKTAYKAWAVAFFVAASLIITGVFRSEVMVFSGVVCASISAGLGEVTFMSIIPLYGDEALNGWSTGTGVAGFIGSFVYASLRFFIPTMYIMLLLLVAPVIMLLAYHFVIRPQSLTELETRGSVRPIGSTDYGSTREKCIEGLVVEEEVRLDARGKMRMLPTIARFFLPLAIVYYAEYFINQGLVELIYYPGTRIGSLELDHATQYTWFQTAYAAGVMISRSSLDLFHIRFLWTMAVLQCANTLLFLAHTSKLIYLPGFLLALSIVFYEGFLGGFTFVNAFHRIKKEVEPHKREFCISSVTSADSTGIVLAALTALPTYRALCSLYE